MGITNVYQEMVANLVKDGEVIKSEVTGEDLHIFHMAVGISGEAGELLDSIKKSVIYRKPWDRENIIEELGDLEFYMEGMRQAFGITRSEVITTNYSKLSKRYKEGKYSNQAAILREDKIPQQVG